MVERQEHSTPITHQDFQDLCLQIICPYSFLFQLGLGHCVFLQGLEFSETHHAKAPLTCPMPGNAVIPDNIFYLEGSGTSLFTPLLPHSSWLHFSSFFKAHSNHHLSLSFLTRHIPFFHFPQSTTQWTSHSTIRCVGTSSPELCLLHLCSKNHIKAAP